MEAMWLYDERRWYGGAISSQLMVIPVIPVARMAPSMESNLLNSDLISCCLALKICDVSRWWTTGPLAMDQGHLMARTPQPIICALASLICWSTRQMHQALQIAWEWLEYHFDPVWYFSNLDVCLVDWYLKFTVTFLLKYDLEAVAVHELGFL